jgi:RND family efflux transporter MFP subunit
MLHPATSRRRRILMRTALLLLAAIAGCGGHGSGTPAEEHPGAPVQAQPAKKIMLGEWTDLFGTTQPLPNHSARISATVEGHVVSVLNDGKVVEGQQVKAGQIIVQLDDRVLRANRAKLQATFHDLEEQEKQARYALELATIDVNRLKELLRGNSSGTGSIPLVSRVELEKAQVLQKDAQSKQKSAISKQAAARAELKAMDAQLEFFTLRAPIAGRLSMVQAVPGQTLNPGAIVADVVDLDPIDVLCYAPPDAVARLTLQQPSKLMPPEVSNTQSASSAGPPLPGKVTFIDVKAQPETGNVPVKVRFPNPDLRLRAHMVVRVHVLTSPERERLTIPESAIMEDLDIPTLIAIQDIKTEEKDGEKHQVGKARKLQVVLGIRDRERSVVEIIRLRDPATGEAVVPEGLLFVTSGAHGLQNDDAVTLRDDRP